MKSFEEILKRGLVVSCQARENEPLYGEGIMTRMALAAGMGGAVGIRADGSRDISDIKKRASLPVIGICKVKTEGYDVYITPTFDAARTIVLAGADIIAIDGTARPRPNGETLSSLIYRIHEELGLPVMADCSTLDEGLAAVIAGANAVSTTLSGYTSYSPKMEKPDLELLKELIQKAKVPVVAEGRYHYPEQAGHAIQLGAYAVVVGSAITRPQEITKRFVNKIDKYIPPQKRRV